MKITDDFVFFYQGPFSNWHRATFTDPVSGITFANSEQAFMWWKADFFRDFGTRDMIANATHPAKAKELGRMITGYNDKAWNLMRFCYMSYVNYLKFSQNPDLAAELEATGNRLPVEASPYDKVWGIGMGLNEEGVENPDNLKGSNILGLVLSAVRLQLRFDNKKSSQ
jgi:ribA/ribD-fused uncharacterized protein